MTLTLGSLVPEVPTYTAVGPLLIRALRTEEEIGPPRVAQHLLADHAPLLDGLQTGHLVRGTFDVTNQLAGYGMFTDPADGFPPDLIGKLPRLRIGITL